MILQRIFGATLSILSLTFIFLFLQGILVGSGYLFLSFISWFVFLGGVTFTFDNEKYNRDNEIRKEIENINT